MTYRPVAGDEIRFTKVPARKFIYRVDQVVLTDEGRILGVVISIVHGGKRKSQLYDLVSFEGFGPVKVRDGGQVESSPEASS